MEITQAVSFYDKTSPDCPPICMETMRYHGGHQATDVIAVIEYGKLPEADRVKATDYAHLAISSILGKPTAEALKELSERTKTVQESKG